MNETKRITAVAPNHSYESGCFKQLMAGIIIAGAGALAISALKAHSALTRRQVPEIKYVIDWAEGDTFDRHKNEAYTPLGTPITRKSIEISCILPDLLDQCNQRGLALKIFDVDGNGTADEINGTHLAGSHTWYGWTREREYVETWGQSRLEPNIDAPRHNKEMLFKISDEIVKRELEKRR